MPPDVLGGFASFQSGPAGSFHVDYKRSALGRPEDGRRGKARGLIGEEEAASLTDVPNIRQNGSVMPSPGQARLRKMVLDSVASPHSRRN
jgi:hypothetical protein